MRFEGLWILIMLATIAGGLGLRAWQVQVRSQRVAHQRAAPWMVEALPDIGAKRRSAAVAAVRAGRFDELPTARSHAWAQQVFSTEE